ncbi:MAG: TRAP transporter large permease [Paracoccaceae bacterium]
MIGTMVVSMLGFMFAGIPIGIAIALAGLTGLIFFTELPMLVLAQQFFISLDSFAYIAIPLFILAGNLMSAGGVSQRLLDFAISLVQNLKGGLAATCVLACMIFAAVSGSSVATTFAIGAILIPAMVKQGYPVGFAAALQASSAELGVIIPPSIPLLLYGMSTGTSIGGLFLAGIGPGILIAATLLLLVIVTSWRKGFAPVDPSMRKGILKSAGSAVLALLMPILIIGGIYGGFTTPTEASVLAVVYALFLGVFVYRELTGSALILVLKKTLVSSSFIMFTIGAAGFFSFILEYSGAMAQIGAYMSTSFSEPWVFLIAVNLMLLVIGMFVDPAVAILILAPLLQPVAQSLGIDPVHFGIIMVVNLAIGMFTPPVGVNLFAVCSIARVPLERVAPSLVPFVLAVIGALALITYIPAISLFPIWLF